MSGIVKRGKKYAGQDRWEKDLNDIQRVTTAPRVGIGTKIAGRTVHFDSVLLLDLLRRREYGTENDSLRSRSYETGSSGGNAAHTQTEAAALWGLPEASYDDEGRPLRDDWGRHVQPDPVGILLEEVFDCLEIMANTATRLEKKLELVLNAGSRAKEMQEKGGDCAACGKHAMGLNEDRLKAGYGPCCYSSFRRWLAKQDYDGMDTTSHVMFQAQRRIELARPADDEILVPCP